MPVSPMVPPARQTVEEVLLTPRVLDRRAFDDYAASLTRLIEDATGEHQTLARTAADVRVLREQLTQAATDAQKRLDAALKVIATLDQRIVEPRIPAPGPAQPASTPPSKARGQRTTPAADNGTPAPGPAVDTGAMAAATQAIEARLSALVENRVGAALEARLTQVLSSSLLEDRIAEAITRQVQQALDERLSGLDQHFEQALDRRLAVLTADIESLRAGHAGGGEPVAQINNATLDECRALVESLRRESWSLVEEARELSGRAADRARSAEESVAALAARVQAQQNAPAPPDTGAIDSLEKGLADRLDERARGFERTIEAAARRFAGETNEQGARLTTQTREAIENARAECEAAVRQISTGATLRVRKAQADVDALLSSLDEQLPARLDAARADFARTFEALSHEAQERAAWLKAALAQAESADLSNLREAVDQARALADPAREGSLAGVVARAADLRAGVETNLIQLSDLSKQVGLMRDLLARSIMDGVAQIDTLDARVEELLLSTARAIERYSAEVDAMRSSLERSIAGDGPIAAPVPDQGETGASGDAAEPDSLTHVESRIAELKTQIDEASRASEWLAGLVDRAARAGITLDEAVTERQAAPTATPAKPARRTRGERSAARAGETGVDESAAAT